ncbi:unnamed protein product [Citrullus colocynthis]|uniref:RRM domain-containing protein n=1 Tax=Citrullus colocynthis TaxID=252529 RepID=A0ABP0XQU7_9ROSI
MTLNGSPPPLRREVATITGAGSKLVQYETTPLPLPSDTTPNPAILTHKWWRDFSSLPFGDLHAVAQPNYLLEDIFFFNHHLHQALTFSSRFVQNVAVSSDYDQEEDTLEADGEDSSYALHLNLFVGNLHSSVDSAQLTGLFESVGQIEGAKSFELLRAASFELHNAVEVDLRVQSFPSICLFIFAKLTLYLYISLVIDLRRSFAIADSAISFLPSGYLHPITVIYELTYGETAMKQGINHCAFD